MSIEQQPPMFANMETLLVKEALNNALGIYTEELGRKLLGVEQAKSQSWLSEAWSFPCGISTYLLGTQQAVNKLWEKLRENPHLFDAVMASAVKLRAMYDETDWAQLVKRQAAGLVVLSKIGPASVADEAVTQVVPNDLNGAIKLLNENPWVMLVLILNYAPLTITPTVLTTILQQAMKPRPAEASNVQ